MHRTRATAVNENKVLADGKWLRCIGNKLVQLGDWVWTDGKCVYGHVPEGGAAHVPASVLSGIPILRSGYLEGEYHPHYMYYAKGKLRDLGQGNEHRRLLNRGSYFTFLEDGLLDAEYDAQGNLYTLERASIRCDWDTGEYVTSGGSCVRRNGETFAAYDLLPFLLSMVQEATAMAKAETEPMDGLDAGSDTEIAAISCMTLGGRVDAQGSFCVIAHITAGVTHTEYAYFKDGPLDRYQCGNRATATLHRRILFDGKAAATWFSGCRLEWKAFSWGSIAGEHWERSGAWYAPDGSLSYPVHDGMRMTFAGKADFMMSPIDGGDYIASIHDGQGSLQLSVPASPLRRVNVCPVGTGKYLVGVGSTLYLWDNGETNVLADGIDNFRIRRMPSLKKWKRTGGV